MLTTNHNAADTEVGSIARLAESWAISLAAENKSPRTIGGYTETLRQFATFLAARGMPTIASAVTREHIEAYLVDVLAQHRPSTAATRYKGLPARAPLPALLQDRAFLPPYVRRAPDRPVGRKAPGAE